MNTLKFAHPRLLIIGVIALSLAGGACKSRGSLKKASTDADRELSGRDGARGADGTALGDGVDATDVEEARIRGKEFVPASDLKVVYFTYDAYSLSEEARLALRENAAYLKANPSLEILVEGHCDDRGTNEYNLALGQKRAKAVRDHYIRLGLPGRSIATISFGEERLTCREETNECWDANRRAMTKIRAQVSSTTDGGGDVR